MVWTENQRVTTLRQRSSAVDVVVEMADGFRRHGTGRNSAALTYYGFLTIFPLFLAATTVLGLVLEGRPDLQEDIVDSAMSQLPMIGSQLASTGQLGTSWWALSVGLLAALWGSLKAFVSIQTAYDDAWEIELEERSNGAIKRLRALIGIIVIGAAQVGTVVLAAVVDQVNLPQYGRILIVLGGLAINVAVVATMYRYLTSASISWSAVWPGSLMTGALYTTFQFAGTAIATRTLDSASAYGTFAATLALLAWLSLHAITNLAGVELNAAIERRRGDGDL